LLPTGRKNPAPAQLAACIAAFKQKRAAESNVYAVSTSAPQTKRIAELDSERDPMLKQVKDIIRTMAGMDIFPEKKAKEAGGLAVALKGVIVKPTDVVDVEKEYQLVPYTE
jgi:hypothetical protein